MDFKQSKIKKKRDIWLTTFFLVSLFFLTIYLTSKISLTIDFSEEKKHSLSLDTKVLINKIESPIDFIITIPETNKNPKIIQRLLHDLGIVLDSFEKYKTKYPIRIHRVNIDTLQNTQLVQKYNLTERNVIIACTPNNKRKIIFRYNQIEGENILDTNSIYRSNNSAARESVWQSGFYSNWKESVNGILEPTKFNGEELILRTILEIASPKEDRHMVYFTQGHGEGSPSNVNPDNGYSELRSIFENYGLDVSTINLSQKNLIPNDCKILVIIGPNGLFYDKEISLIRSFLNNGGGLLIALDPNEENSVIDKPAYGLRTLLKEWGIRCHDMLLYDPDRRNFDVFSGDYWLKTYSKNSKNSIVEELRSGMYSIKSSRLRPVEAIIPESEDYEVNEIIFSSKSSWAVSSWTDRTFPPTKNKLLDLDGPVPIIVTSKKYALNNDQSKNSRIAVLGSSSIVNNKKLKESTGNKIICKNLINWLSKKEQLTAIEGKKLEFYNVEMNEEEFHELLYSMSIIPFAIAILGGFVGWLRKDL